MRIGVTSADDPTPDNYVNAVTRYGANAVVLHAEDRPIEIALAGITGLIITGGSDIATARYTSAPSHPANDSADHERDAFELAAVRHAGKIGLPLLMICRGLQIANVAFGGTLHQHIPDLGETAVIHRDLDRKFEVFPEHWVTIDSDSALAALLGSTRCMTNASHHQAVDQVGRGLRAVAHTDDGIIEALEYPDARAFWLAVQWHPERLLDSDAGRSPAIFAAFLAAAHAYDTSLNQEI